MGTAGAFDWLGATFHVNVEQNLNVATDLLGALSARGWDRASVTGCAGP